MKTSLAYPIKPRHLDTSEEPKGFDAMLEYGERMILWGLIQFCQHRGNWNKFTWDEFMKFFDDTSISIHGPLRSGVLFFTGPGVNYLFLKHVGEDKATHFTPSHYLITTYFLWNPSVKIES